MSDATPVEIVVASGSDCVGEDALWSALARRSSRIVRGRGADRCEVRSSAARGSATGSIVAVRSGRASAPRTIEAASCAELVEALALVAALAWDSASAGSAPSVAPDAAVPSSPPPASPRTWTFSVGLKAGGWAVGTGSPLFAWGGLVDVERSGTGLAPSFRLGASHAETRVARSGADVDLAWNVLRASSCPLAWSPTAWLRVGPCAAADVGLLHASSPQGRSPATRPWLGVGLGLGLSARPTGRLFVEITPSVTLPLVRDELALEPLTLYRAPAVVGAVEMSAGVRFP